MGGITSNYSGSRGPAVSLEGVKCCESIKFFSTVNLEAVKIFVHGIIYEELEC